MKIIDLSGPVYSGMWGYEPPFPSLNIKPLPKVPWVRTEVYCEIFDGLHSQTGTYLETPAHFLGDRSYPLCEVPIERLTDIPCTVIMLDGFSPERPETAITCDMLLSSPAFSDIREGDAVLIGCGWGRYWRDERYLSASPYFTADAMRLLISKKPFLLGSDFPRWDCLSDPQGFFEEFYAADILMLAPVINLESVRGHGGLLTALPLRAEVTSCAPCRAILKTEL